MCCACHVTADGDVAQTCTPGPTAKADGGDRDWARRPVQRLLGHAPDEHPANSSTMRRAEHQQVGVPLLGRALQRRSRARTGNEQRTDRNLAVEEPSRLL